VRLTFLTTLYPSYIAAFYAARPGLEGRSYEDQKSQLDRDGYAWNGALEPAFRPLGYEVRSVYANVAPLQRAWAAAHGISHSLTGWVEEIALSQIQLFNPEILWVDALGVFRKHWIERLRMTCPALRRVLGFTGVDMHDWETIKACDAMFSCARHPVAHLKQAGGKAFLFRHGFNPAILDQLPLARTPPVNQILFTGSIARGEGAHLERERLLEAIVDAVPISIYSPQSEISYLRDWAKTNLRRGVYFFMQALKKAGVSESTLRKIPKVGGATDWRKLPLRQINPHLYPRMRPPFYGQEMFGAMRDHAVTLNKHIDMARGEAGNSRLFEATGVGACLLTDWKDNLAEMFEPDREVAVYRNIGECVEKARWLLADAPARAAFARAGQARVLREHTFAHRAIELDRLIHAELM
jgi:spore maturation protein CgeB